MYKILILVMLSLSVAACSGGKNTKPITPKPECKPCASQTSSSPPVVAEPEPKRPTEVVVPATEFSLLKPAQWSDLEGILQDDLTASWNAWLTSCSTLKQKMQWKSACLAATSLTKPTSAEILNYYTQHFDVYSTSNQNGSNEGLITGYYQPVLNGSRTPSAKYAYPLYGVPADLISVELSALYPELKYKRLRGKLDGNKLVPYLSRADIEQTSNPLAGNEILWVDDALDAFYLQIQGSGLIKLENGEQVHVGYADQNGHAYNSIGKILVQRGELTADQASMQGIKDWARKNPGKLQGLLNSNPSYVFFRELPSGLFGPLGALGVPLTAERSVAIDPKYVPLGAPIFLSTTYPNSNKPLKRLMMAQDTGGAIKDGVRADFYWGSGEAAGKAAGAMKQSGLIWVLLPKGFKLP
jgi:membrane-bound lytic murein transglycosylase A